MSANIFTVKRSEIEGRLDPEFYNPKYFEIFRIKKSNWTRLNSIVKTLKHPPEYKRVFAENGYQLIRSQNVRPTGIDLSENPVYLSKEIVENNSGILPKKGDILVVRSGVNAGDIAVVEDELKNTTIGADTLLLNVTSEILPKFVQVYFYTDTGRNQLNRYITGATNKHINSFSLKRVYFPIIDLHTQKKCISTFENALSQKEQKQEQAKELLASIDSYLLSELGITLPQKDNSLSKRIFTTKFSEVTGERWDCSYTFKISALARELQKIKCETLENLIICNPQYGANEEAVDYSEGSTRYIRITDIDELGNLKEVDLKSAETIEEKYLLNENDILFARSGSVGRCYIHKDMTRKSIFAGYLIRFVLNKELINPDYLFYYCNSSIYKYWVDSIQRPAVQANINSQEYKSLTIPLPPLPKQKEIAEHIRGIRAQAKQLQTEAEQILQDAKHQVEKMILGE